MKNETLLTKGAVRHLRLMLRAIAPMAGRLDRECRAFLRTRPHEPALIRALLAITPAAASRLRTIDAFLEQVEYNGRRIAKMNLPPAEVVETLGEFDACSNARSRDDSLRRGSNCSWSRGWS